MRIPVCILPGHVHVFPPWPINRLIFTQTHHTVNGRNHFSLWSRTIFACQFFDTYLRASEKTWTSLWSCSWCFCGLQILHIQDQNQIGSVPSQKHILALHTSATSAAGVSAGVSAFTYRHKHGTVNNLWIICPFHSQIHPESVDLSLHWNH